MKNKSKQNFQNSVDGQEKNYRRNQGGNQFNNRSSIPSVNHSSKSVIEVEENRKSIDKDEKRENDNRQSYSVSNDLKLKNMSTEILVGMINNLSKTVISSQSNSISVSHSTSPEPKINEEKVKNVNGGDQLVAVVDTETGSKKVGYSSRKGKYSKYNK